MPSPIHSVALSRRNGASKQEAKKNTSQPAVNDQAGGLVDHLFGAFVTARIGPKTGDCPERPERPGDCPERPNATNAIKLSRKSALSLHL